MKNIIIYSFKINFQNGGAIMTNLLFYTGIFSTVILVIQVILTLIGMGAESPEFDADTDMDFDGHLKLLFNKLIYKLF